MDATTVIIEHISMPPPPPKGRRAQSLRLPVTGIGKKRATSLLGCVSHLGPNVFLVFE